MTCPFVDQNRFVTGPPLGEEQKKGCRKCHAITKAFSAFSCSGSQEDFVSDGKFRVCRSACDALFDACGLPTHRGGIFTAADFDKETATFKGDYEDAASMCAAMWNPHESSIWEAEGIELEVVDDAEEGHEGCVALEREVHDLRYDTTNMIFNYEIIRSGEGFCSTEDPLYDKELPCEDLQKAKDEAELAVEGGGGTARGRRRKLGNEEKVNGGASM